MVRLCFARPSGYCRPTTSLTRRAISNPPGKARVWEYGGTRIGIAICEDIWWETEPAPGARYPVDPVHDLLDAGAEIILAPSASPFHSGKVATRFQLTSSIGRNSGVPLVYVNSVGGNDSLVFDGYSMVTGCVTVRYNTC